MGLKCQFISYKDVIWQLYVVNAYSSYKKVHSVKCRSVDIIRSK